MLLGSDSAPFLGKSFGNISYMSGVVRSLLMGGRLQGHHVRNSELEHPVFVRRNVNVLPLTPGKLSHSHSHVKAFDRYRPIRRPIQQYEEYRLTA